MAAKAYSGAIGLVPSPASGSSAPRRPTIAMRDEQSLPSSLAGGADGDHGRSSGVHALDDLGVVDALQVHGGDAGVAVAELALDRYERYAFVVELDGGRMPQPVQGEAAPDSSGRRGVARLRASGRDTRAARASDR